MKSKAYQIGMTLGLVLALTLGVAGLFMPRQGVVVRQAGSGPGAQAMGDAWAVDYWGTELVALDTSGNLDVTGDFTADTVTADTVTATTWVTESTDLSLSGNLAVGNGTPTVTQNGEDAYVEGQFEVDGEAQFDGAIDANSAVAIDGGLTNIGGGTPDVADGDNDLYVTAVLEVDGETQLDGVLDANSTADIQGTLTLQGLLLSSFANLTITDGYTLTAVVTTYALDSAGAVGMTLNATGTEGQILILIGDDANNITIADSNIRSSDGNAIVLGQYDVAMFVYQDAEWVLVSSSANS